MNQAVRDGAPPTAAAKHELSDLALFGGLPSFSGPLHVGRPNIGDREALHARLDGALDRAWLTNDGPLVQELEARIELDLGIAHAVAVTNATVGLQIAARAAGSTGQVVMPSFTFVATPHAFEWIGLEPVFADIDLERLTLDPAAIDAVLAPETSTIVATHVFGRSADVERLTAIAARHGLTLLFDAAHAYGCERDGRRIGSFGQAEVFSFHATKYVNGFEGGVITTDDEAFAARCRSMRNYGFTGWDTTEGVGTNGKMHEASAAMLLTSLDAADAFTAVNGRNLARYRDGLAGLAGLTTLPDDDRGRCNDQHVVLRIDEMQAPLSRDTLQALLTAENVLARRYFHPGCHRLEPYAQREMASLPRTERATDEVLLLPTGTGVDETDIDVICDLVRFAWRHADAVTGRMAASAC